MQLMKLYQGKKFSSLTNFGGNYYRGTLLLWQNQWIGNNNEMSVTNFPITFNGWQGNEFTVPPKLRASTGS